MTILRILLLLCGLWLLPARAQEEGGPHEEGPVIENWWSWDYGAGKTHKHPPFGFMFVNFAVYLYILYRLGGRSFSEFLKGRHHAVRRALDEAAEVHRQAQAELVRYQERIARIDSDMDALARTVRAEAEAEKQRIIAAAQAQAEQLQRDAAAQIVAEIARARIELRQKVAYLSLAAAEMLVKSKIQEADHKRLFDEYVTRLEAPK